VPSSEGEDVKSGLELQSGLPWSGYVYHPDFSSISLTHDVVPSVLTVIAGLELVVVADARVLVLVLVLVSGAETSTDREAERVVPSACNALTVRT
jgi:hypothetical protein